MTWEVRDSLGVLQTTLVTQTAAQSYIDGVGLQPGDQLQCVGTINLTPAGLVLPSRGTADNEIVITSRGGAVTQEVDALTELTWALPAAWSDGAFSDGAVVTHSGSQWTAVAAISAGQEPGVHANWKDTGGTTYEADLTGVYSDIVRYMRVDGSMTKSRRWVGTTNSGNRDAFFQEVGEWAAGGPGIGHTSESPTKLYIRADSTPTTEFTELKCGIGMGAYIVEATGSATPAYIRFEDAIFNRVPAPMAWRVLNAGTDDLVGMVAKNCTITESGVGVYHTAPASVAGGPQFAVRDWLIEGNSFTTMADSGFRSWCPGTGIMKGNRIIDYSLQTSYGGIYSTTAPGGEYDTPDKVYFEENYVSQSGGLFTQINGFYKFFQGDSAQCYYSDTGCKNHYYIGNEAKDAPLTNAYNINACGGTITLENNKATNVDRLFKHNGSEGLGLGVIRIDGLSGNQIHSTEAPIWFAKSNENTHTLTNILVTCTTTATGGILNESTPGSDVAVSFAKFENVTGTKTEANLGTVTEGTGVTTGSGLFAGTDSCAIDDTSPALYAGTTGIFQVPAYYSKNASDDLFIDTSGITDWQNWAIAMTLRRDGTSPASSWVFQLGPNNDNFYALFLSSGNLMGIKKVATAQVNTTFTALGVGAEYRVVLSMDGAGGFNLHINGTKYANGTTTWFDATGSTLNIGGTTAGAHSSNVSVRDVLVIPGLVTDAEKVRL